MTTRPKRGEHGQATVEFAIVLPLVLVILVGLIEFGKAFNYWLSLNHIAGETARWAAVDKIPPYPGDTDGATSPNATDFTNYLLGQVETQELRDKIAADLSNNVALCFSGGTNPLVGDAATVRVRAPYSFLLVPIDITLAGTATVRFEQPPTAGTWANPCPP